MLQRFQITLGLNRPVENPLLKAREILGDLRSGVVTEAHMTNLALTATFERRVELRERDLPRADDLKKWGVEIVLMNPVNRGVRVLSVRELERKYTASERVNEILEPVEARIMLEKALKH